MFCVLLPAWWTRYLDSVSAAGLAQIPFSLLFLELSDYYANTVRLHVNAADVLVRHGIDRDGSRQPPFGTSGRAAKTVVQGARSDVLSCHADPHAVLKIAGLPPRRPHLPNSGRWPFGYLCSVWHTHSWFSSHGCALSRSATSLSHVLKEARSPSMS